MGTVDTGELARWLRRVRVRRRSSASDWYVRTFSVLVLGSMVGSLLLRNLPLQRSGVASTPACLLTAAAVGAVSWLVAWLTGPLGVERGYSFWLLAGPADRRVLLRRPYLGLLVVAAVAGALAAAIAWFVAPLPIAWLPLIALLPPCIAAAAVWCQERRGLRHAFLATASCLALLAVAAAIPAGATALACVALAGIGVAAERGLHRLDRYELARRAGAGSSLGGAAASGDAGLILDLVANRALHRHHRLRPRGRRALGVASLDARRVLFRATPQLLALVVVDLVVLALRAHTGPAVTVAIFGLMLAFALQAGTLRALRRSPGLRRLLPLRRALPTAAVAGTLLVALANAGVLALILATRPGATLVASTLTALALTLSGLAAAVRWVSSPPPDFTSALLMTDAGPMSLGAARIIVRGPELALSLVGIALLGLPWWVVAALAFVALVVQLRPEGTRWKPTLPGSRRPR